MKICDECETVAHCTKHGCIPKVSAKDSAMRLALEALELAQDNLRDHGDNCFLHDEGEYNRCFCGKDSLSNHLQSVVEKLDEALAEQPAQQEPCDMGDLCIGCNPRNIDGSCPGQKPTGDCDCYVNGFNNGMKELEQPSHQKPVAWWIPKAKQFCLPSSDGTRPFAKAWEPLYTSPPAQRTWVGLTDIDYAGLPLEQVGLVRWAEAKLRSKNESKN